MSSDVPVIELFIQASTFDKKSKRGNGNIGTQRWIMAYGILQEKGLCTLEVIPVDPALPDAKYAEISTGTGGRFPILYPRSGSVNGQDISGLLRDTVDDIESLMRQFGCDELSDSTEESSAEGAFLGILPKLNNMICNPNANSDALVKELKKLERYLQKNPTKYLFNDTLCYADCELAPILQHVRVAGKFYTSLNGTRGTFDLAAANNVSEFQHIWKYMANLYTTDLFKNSCPEDRDIVERYESKLMGQKRPSRNSMNHLEGCTLDVPEGVSVE